MVGSTRIGAEMETTCPNAVEMPTTEDQRPHSDSEEGEGSGVGGEDEAIDLDSLCRWEDDGGAILRSG
jgi:hypothetical protein